MDQISQIIISMAISLGRFSWCLWAQGKDKEPISNGSPSVELGFGLTLREPKKKKKRIASSRKWKSREERRTMRIDPEFDFVVVPTSSDGGDCLSGGDSDDNSDMSIGWIEPHGPGFQTRDSDHDHDDDDDLEGGFAVLVPCYSPGCKELAHGSNSAVFRAITNLPIDFSPDCKNYMEQLFPFKALMPRERADILL